MPTFHGPYMGADDTPDTSQPIEADVSIPDEIEQFLAENEQIVSNKFSYKLYRLKGEALDVREFIADYSNSVLSFQDVGTKYGPGTYECTLVWRELSNGEDGKKKQEYRRKPFKFSISDSYETAHEEYLAQEKIRALERRNALISKTREKRQLMREIEGVDSVSGKAENVQDAARAYIDDILAATEKLGLRNGAAPAKSIDWGSLLTGLSPLVLGFLEMMRQNSAQARSEQMQMMQLMIGLSNKSNEQILALAHRPEKGADDMMKDMFNTVMSGIDMKKALKEATEEPKESTMDKVLGVIRDTMPIITAMATMPKGLRENNPLVKQGQAYIQNNPDMQAIIADRDAFQRFVATLDDQYGEEKIDQLLEFAKVNRPKRGSDEEAYIPATETDSYTRESGSGGSYEEDSAGDAEFEES